MFKRFAGKCVRVINRWLPDPFLFVIILTIVVFLAALYGTGLPPTTLITVWGSDKGLWSLLAFSMQMALVLVLGSAMAHAEVCHNLMSAIAGFARSKTSAIIVTTIFSAVTCWLNWGFGLVIGALLAKEIARRVKDVDYPLLIASAYSGFLIWHAGLSGSIPVQIAGGYSFKILGNTVLQVPLSETVFHPVNIAMCVIVLIGMPVLNCMMHPDEEHTVKADPSLLLEDKEAVFKFDTPADGIEHSIILWALMIILMFVYLYIHFFMHGADLNLNVVNTIFLFLGILLHCDLRKYVDAVGKAVVGSAGILLQFPFYAGIMALMVIKNPANGVSLVGLISDFFIDISDKVTFPLYTFISAGIINFFLPSGGGQWDVQGPIVMKAAADLGVETGRAAMAIAWGDQWTNMIQPFWTLPALGIAGLSARNIMGYLIVVFIASGVLACTGFWIWGAFF